MGDLLTKEEIEALLVIVDAEDENLSTEDMMLDIHNNISALISNYIKEHYKYPNTKQLIKIYNRVFTDKFKYLREHPEIYWYCNDIVKNIKTRWGLTIKMDDDELSAKVIQDICPY